MILARAAVRAQQKRGKEVVADFKRVLQPHSKDLVPFYQMGRQILMMAGSSQFRRLHKDKDFLEFITWLQKRLQEIEKKLRSTGGG